MNKEITLKSNCVATIIPAGEEVTLAEVLLSQSLNHWGTQLHFVMLMACTG